MPITDDASPYLYGWKRIAAYLDFGCVRTAQRHADAGLPVYRIPGRGRKPAVFARKAELDQWRRKTKK